MKKKGLLIIVYCLLLGLNTASAEEAKMKITVSNSLDQAKEKMFFRQDLPLEIKKEDVIDTGTLTLAYDEQKSLLYVHGEIDLAGNESRDYMITIHDVWRIANEGIDFLLTQAGSRLMSLEGKEIHDIAKLYHGRITAWLDDIRKSQESEISDVNTRIESYRVNTQRLKDIQQAVSLIENFSQEAQRFSDFEKEKKIIKLVIESENSSKDSKVEKAEIIRYLPMGIRPDYLVDIEDFSLRYDLEKDLFYLTKVDDFEPGEKKKYEIIIADMWYILTSRLDQFEKIGDGLALKLTGSSYDKLAAYIVLEIKKSIGEIKSSQLETKTADDKIALYGINIHKLDEIIKKINQLRNMVDEMDRAKSKKITEVVKSVTPDVATTWKLIYAVIGFLAFISILFFLLWWGQSKAKLGKKIDDLATGEKIQNKK